MSEYTGSDAFSQQYLETALWSSTEGDDGGAPLDDRFTPENLDAATIQRMIGDCAKFQAENAADIDGRDSDAGHDFWLTRNGHGAGFRDGDWPEPAATRLTTAARAFGTYDLLADGETLFGFPPS